MIRARALRGLTVVDVAAAAKVGQIEEVFLTPDYDRVAGFLVSQGQSLLNKGASIFLPADCVRAVGPDALTIIHSGVSNEAGEGAAQLPRMSHLVGQKVVSESGRLLGSLEDALIDVGNGRVLSYELAAGSAGNPLESLLGGHQARRHDYVRGDAPLRVGPDLIVVPDEALFAEGELDTAHPTETGAVSGADVGAASGLSAAPLPAASSGWADPLPITMQPDIGRPVAPVLPTTHAGGLHPVTPASTNLRPEPPVGFAPVSPLGAPPVSAVPGVLPEARLSAAPGIAQSVGIAQPTGVAQPPSPVQHGIDNDPHHDPAKGAALGGVGGAAVGAAAGSMVGPLGTIVGAILGGLSGAVGSGAAVAAVDQVDNDNTLTGMDNWEHVAPHYRAGWEQQHGPTGAKWEAHEPIYRFAWERRHMPAYQQRGWAEAEADLQRDWESAHPRYSWSQARNSVRAGWEVSDQVMRQRQRHNL